MVLEPHFSRTSDTDDRFLSFVTMERGRHTKRLYMAIFLSILIACLLYETQWPMLRPGLLVLLIGQFVDALALYRRNVQLAHDLEQKKVAGLNEVAMGAWFGHQESFIKLLAIFDSSCQAIGFLALGYAFWISTQSLGLALAIGVIYPLTFYLGITRVKTIAAIKRLSAKKQELEMR
jgi:hypothetical protein